MNKKAKKKISKNPFRIAFGIIMLIIIAIKAIFFDWIIEWLFSKKSQYLILKNFDKSFEISIDLFNAICAYPTIALKPRRYHCHTKIYYGYKKFAAKSISKANLKSMVGAWIENPDDPWNPLIDIFNGAPSTYNRLTIRFEDSEIPKFVNYLKNTFIADYGYVCEARSYQSKCIGDTSRGSSAWQTGDSKKVCQGYLKDVYTVNILNSAHVQDSLINKIKEDERMGCIDSSVDGYIIWNVAPSNIRYARRVCKKMGLLI